MHVLMLNLKSVADFVVAIVNWMHLVMVIVPIKCQTKIVHISISIVKHKTFLLFHRCIYVRMCTMNLNIVLVDSTRMGNNIRFGDKKKSHIFVWKIFMWMMVFLEQKKLVETSVLYLSKCLHLFWFELVDCFRNDT